MNESDIYDVSNSPPAPISEPLNFLPCLILNSLTLSSLSKLTEAPVSNRTRHFLSFILPSIISLLSESDFIFCVSIFYFFLFWQDIVVSLPKIFIRLYYPLQYI